MPASRTPAPYPGDFDSVGGSLNTPTSPQPIPFNTRAGIGAGGTP